MNAMIPVSPVRQAFPDLDRYAYFNYGGQGLTPSSAIEAVYASQRHLQSIGPFSTAAYDWSNQAIHDLRTILADSLKATTDSLTLTGNTTEGCNIVLWGIDWKPGDHLVMTDCEHQGIIAIVRELQHRFGLEVTIAPILETLNSGDPVTVIESCLKPTTRLVVFSHILWNTGQVLDAGAIARLCQSRGIQTLVDGAQSVGVLPLNLLNLADSGLDFYAFTTHKWWGGPPGVGALYVRESAREGLRPTAIGWRSIRTDLRGQPTDWEAGGKRYEVSTAPVYAFPGTTAAIAFHTGTPEERYAQICQRSLYLWEGLRSISQVTCLKETAPESGLVAFQLGNQQHRQLVAALESQQIFVRLLLNPNCVRACTHYFTTEAECDRLLAAVAGFSSSFIPSEGISS
jgi:L-cysteine/cystine lyase